MRKILAFLVLLMLPWTARGQALADWYYWFDMEEAPHESGTVTNQQFQIPVDVSHLNWGLHTLYVQVKDTGGVYSTPHGEVFYNIPANGQRLSNFCYWFDGDIDVKELPYNQGNYQIDITGLNPGFHFINYYVKDELGGMTGFKSSGFYRMPMLSRQKLNYWFSGDATAIPVSDYRDGFIIDVTRLQEGFNTIYFQMEDNGPTDIQSYNFIKVPQTENAGDMTLVCIIDGQVVGEEKVAAHGGVVRCDMDVNNIEVGMHKAMFQLISPSGAGSSIAETYFIRTLTNDDIASMQCSYTIDGMHNRVHKGTCTNGVFHFDLPVDEVEDGLHRIDFMLIAENGATTTQGNAWFFKTPLGGNAITQYDYWLNDKSDDVQMVQLDTPVDPFQLIKLIPISAEPIRSSCFHFEVKDGKPMMYAKNDIHFRFHDKSGRWVDADKQYVDYNVSETVTDIANLQTTQTFARPEENGIKWFKFEAAPGDTIGFKASQATSLQVFAPSGKEILSTMGDKSVQYTGAHTWETGTYYVAVHDVTGSKPNVTLDYFHMDKYDVVAQDVRVVGNGGCSTITFQGNGFRDLYAVDLYTAQGDTIHSIDIGHESDAETTVTFDFTDAELGKYDVLFRFAEGEKTLVQNITVEEAKDIELITSVTYPTSFLRGTSTTYTVKITNKGNMTAYYVPVYLYLESKTFEGVKSIYIDGVHKIPILNTELDSLSVEEEAFRLELLEAFSDKHYFWHSWAKDEIGDSVLVRSNYFFTDVSPNSTKYVTLEIQSNETVCVKATIPEQWNSLLVKEEENNPKNARRNSLKSSYCCIADQLECGVGLLAGASDWVSLFVPGAQGVNCALASANTALPVINSGICGGRSAGQIGKNLIASAPSLALACIPLVKGMKELHKTYMSAGAITYDFLLAAKTLSDCGASYKNPKPGCPPTPPQGGSSTPVNSLDPNEIFGYTAESGSKFVADSIVGLNYRIEFENDTTFATASAHVVEIRDTLDSRVLDLQSYAPTSIKIGEKTETLDGTPNFLKTIDMRPVINAIVQVEGKYDAQKGIATWLFTSLDPMTMEPTDDVMQGFLPVNYDGVSGIGEVSFDINRKAGLTDGEEIHNRASITFDANEPILTPVWTNIIDAVPPTSHVSGTEMLASDSVRVHFEGQDERSGIWKYELYVQYGADAPWWKIGETDSTYYDMSIFDDIEYGFCVLATDSAGNVEKKELARECGLETYIRGDANGDGKIDIKDAILILNYYVGIEGTYLNTKSADVNGDGVIDVKDAVWVSDHYVNDTNNAKSSAQKSKRQKIRIL